jgi:integrase/recombinase XerD
MKKLILSPKDLMWKTVFCMYAKTGIRRQEPIDLDEDDINLRYRKIYLKKHHPKRSNNILFIDDELHFFLSQWLKKDITIIGINTPGFLDVARELKFIKI